MPDHPSWPAELVEKGARAICEAENDRDTVTLRYEDWREEYDAKALAVLSALSGDLVPREEHADEEAMERGTAALCRYVFPGCIVPRAEMARAVLAAAASPNWPDVSDKLIITRVAPSQADALAEALEEISGAAKTWAGLAPGVAVGWFAAIQKAADEALAAFHSPVSSNDGEKSNTTTGDQWTRRCAECDAEFSSFPRDSSERCGNCAATTHLPRCEHRWPDLVGGDTFRCQRPVGHIGHHTYGRRRA